MNSEEDQFQATFFPYATNRTAHFKSKGCRFAYYTSAETAFRILSKQEVWLRNARLMNDFSEIQHGLACLTAAYSGEAGAYLTRLLDAWFPGLPQEVSDMFSNRLGQIQFDTYLTCLSEHESKEDVRGRLSMWRAYGGRNGVAIIINGQFVEQASDALGAYSSPVFYGTPEDFVNEFTKVVHNIAANETFVRRLERDVVKNAVFGVLRYGAVCTKHPGFIEEAEWRVVASPTIESPPRLLRSFEVVRSVPQKVLKIKLENSPEEGLVGLAPAELIDRIIIGPCEFPEMTAMTFFECLQEAGVPDPAKKIVVSDIPLRHIA